MQKPSKRRRLTIFFFLSHNSEMDGRCSIRYLPFPAAKSQYYSRTSGPVGPAFTTRSERLAWKQVSRELISVNGSTEPLFRSAIMMHPAPRFCLSVVSPLLACSASRKKQKRREKDLQSILYSARVVTSPGMGHGSLVLCQQY